MIHINILVFTFICFPMLVFAGPASEAVKVIEQKHIHRQKCKYGFQCSSLGGGGDGKRFTHLSIGFNTRKTLTIQSARRLIVESVINYHNEINSREELKSHFVEWPLPLSKIDYDISVLVDNGVRPKFPNGPTPDQRISFVQFLRGDIDYVIDIERLKPLKVIHKETLDEAIAILKAEGWKEPSRYHSHAH